jgi:hypothetical protein
MLLSEAIGLAGPALELAIILLLLRKKLWRVYTFLFVYAFWLLIGNSVILGTFLYFSKIYPDFPNVYPALYWKIYWNIDSIDVVLRFVVIWEIFRQTFPKRSGLNKSLSKGLGIGALALLAAACSIFLIYQDYAGPRSIHLALDRSFGFVQALMILGTLVTARYYGVRYGRNIRGIALAFGAWVSVSTATNAMVDLTNSFLPYWYYLRPLSFVGMIGVWIWALWVYEPNPPIMESGELELSQWNQEWNRTISATRTIMRP